jgi:uncharacterized membrane protein YdjX (TVP38/TMEM64 family)
MRLLWTFIALAALLCLPFLVWGDEFTGWFTGDAAIAWIRGYGMWGGLAVIGLLVSDLVLPIPSTPVMSAAGYLYGPWLGGLLSAAGSFCSGMVGYGLCRACGRRLALKLVSAKELADHDTLFQRSGPWLVAASRWMPLLPEVMCCLAGLTRMPLATFAVSLACGSIPLGFVYAWVGAVGRDMPRLTIALSLIVPVVLWAAARPLLPSLRNRADR